MRAYRVTLDPAAVEDLRTLRDHVASASGNAIAEGLAGRILQYIESFETAPKRGRLRDDIRPGLRVVGWRRTVTIAFSVDDEVDEVRILAVFYRGRDVAGALKSRP